MSVIEINWNPDDKMLRGFGCGAAAICPVVSAVLYMWKDLDLLWCGVIAGAGIAIFLCSLVSLRITRWLYLALTVLTFPIGFVVSYLVLGLFFYVVLTPLGLCFRLMGRDPLRLRGRDQGSYWTKRDKVDDMKRYFRQF